MRKPLPFGKYLLLDRIAVGGMAEVFAAKTFGVEGFERIVAVKRILPTMVEDDEFITMFIDEARIASQLSHANLVQIHDLGKVEDSFFIGMEYIPGRDVRLIIDKFKKKGGTLPIPMAVFIMARVCEGLDYAHRRKDAQGRDLGIIHRDVSPQNVLVSYEGDVKVIDFGIAKAAGRLQKTQSGILKGKFGYMSPEQVKGMVIDHRSDIFSAGVMFYEMLTGSKLFTGESDFSTLELVRAGEVPPPRDINPNIPVALERVVLKALAKDRDQRYLWASDFHDDLLRFLYAGDEVFSTKTLAGWMKENFPDEYRKENDRQRRWEKMAPEETSDFESTSSSPPVPVPAQVIAASRNSGVSVGGAAGGGGGGGLQASASPAGAVRIGPPSAFMTSELRLQDRTGVFEPFGGGAPDRTDEDAPRAPGERALVEDEMSMKVTDAVSLADLGLAEKPAPGRGASPLSDDRGKAKRASMLPPKGDATLPPMMDVNEILDTVRKAKNAGAQKKPSAKDGERRNGSAAPPPPAPPPPPPAPVEVRARPTSGEFVPASRDRQARAPEPLDPLPPPPPAPRGFSRAGRFAIVGLAAVVVLLLVVGVWRSTRSVKGVFIGVYPSKGAVIYIDGIKNDSPPPLSARLATGEHTLRVEAEGYEPHEEQFVVEGERVALSVELRKSPEEEAPPAEEPREEPPPEPTTKAPDPAPAPKAPGKTPPTRIVEAPSPRVIEPPRPKAVTTTAPIVVPAPVPVVVVPPPPPAPSAPPGTPGSLMVFSDPRGAMVAVDGKMIGRSPVAAEDLPGGKLVEVKLVLPGYRPLTIMQEVTPGKKEVLRLSLQSSDSQVNAPAPVVKAPPVEEAPPPRAAPVAGPKAFLTAMCVPVGKLLVDGKDTGRWTPITAKDAIELAPGKHIVTCETTQGTRAKVQEFQMDPGGKYSFRAKID